MYLIIVTLEELPYYYGPYTSRQVAEQVVEAAENRKGNRAPDMHIVLLQPSDAFLLGNHRVTYRASVPS